MNQYKKNVAHSIFHRLLNRAKTNREDFNLLLSRYGMERFLYRLSVSAHNGRFIPPRGPLRHKIGNAKPLGMGSCHIRIERWELLPDARRRFTSLQTNHIRQLEGEALKTEIGRWIQGYVTDRSETMDRFRKMMIWDEADTRIFSYPTFEWFRNPNTSGLPLKRM